MKEIIMNVAVALTGIAVIISILQKKVKLEILLPLLLLFSFLIILGIMLR